MRNGRLVARFYAVAACIVCLVSPVALGATSIANTAQLDAATDGLTPRTFTVGNYAISSGGVQISSSAVDYILDNTTKLSIPAANSLAFTGNLAIEDRSEIRAVGHLTTFDALKVGGNLVQSGGTIVAQGGASTHAVGLTVGGASGYTINGGTTYVTGGGGEDAYGAHIWWHGIDQNGGILYAVGGQGEDSLGVWISSGAYTQTTGTLVAKGGSGDNSVGLVVDDTAVINGNLLLWAGSGRGADSMVVSRDAPGAGTTLTFGPSSLLTVELDGDRSGNVIVVDGDVDIQPGAALTVMKTRAITPGSSGVYEFMTLADGVGPGPLGTINGAFATPNSVTLGFSAYKGNNDTSYFIKVKRIATVQSALTARDADSNGGRAMSAIEGASYLPAALSAAYSYLDNNSGDANFARWAGGGLTPQQNAQAFYAVSSLHTMLAETTFRYMENYSLALTTAEASPDAWRNAQGNASLAPPGCAGSSGSTLWAAPFYSTGTQDGKTDEFADLDQDYTGLSLGYARVIDRTDFGFGFHYVRGDYDASDYDADSDTYGLTLAGRHRFIGNGTFAPELSAWAGYSYTGLDQNRLSAPSPRSWLSSDPDINQWYAGTRVANSFQITRIFSIKPWAGLEYSYQRQGSYRERGDSGLELDVAKSDYNSLLGSLGVETRFDFTPRSSLKLFGVYEFEFADRRATLRSAFVAAPAIVFDAKSQNLSRNRGRVGAEFKHYFTERFSASAGYALRLADHYLSHNIGVGLALEW